MPNLWHYLIVLIGECWCINITLTHKYFTTCFLLCKEKSGYCLTTCGGFKVNGALPTTRVGRSTSFRSFESRVGVWSRLIDILHGWHPLLWSDEEIGQVFRFRDIISFSEAIRKMDEDWLINVGLSLASRGMTRTSYHFTSSLFLTLYSLVIVIL